jgi:surface antigen
MVVMKKLLIATFLVLGILGTSSGTANAQEIPLSEKQQLIEQKVEVVEQKMNLLTNTAEELASLEEKKVTLLEQLEAESKSIEELKQKVEEKRARAEAERKRLEELKKMFVRVDRYASNSAGNTYAPGNCTWYAKSRRPDLPNSLGNANTWYYRAQALGWNVGSTPKKGAVATTTAGGLGHVAIVDGVSLDGQFVTITEMNYRGLYSMNTRTVHYTEFKYIYELN